MLIYQKRHPVRKFLNKWMTKYSRLFEKKTTLITASPIWLEYDRIFPNLYFDEQTELITIKTLPLKNNDTFPQ